MELFFFDMIPANYYWHKDVVFLAKDLIGKILCSQIDGHLIKSIIVETEAYAGITDKASHAYNGKFTDRTKVMYKKGGTSYVYLCYGIHHLFNIVTNDKGIPHAVLIRGVIPLNAHDIVLKRRRISKLKFDSCIGPAKVSQAHGFNLSHNDCSLVSTSIYLEENPQSIQALKIKSSKRIGIDYAEEDALLPYRFHLDNINLKSIFQKVSKIV